MLPPAARLRRRPEFTSVVRSGGRAASRTVVVHLNPDPTAATALPRVGFVVGRAVGPAVVRNRVRRRLRHVVQVRLDQLAAASPGARLVVRALPAAAAATSAQLGADVDAACARALAQQRQSGPPGPARVEATR